MVALRVLLYAAISAAAYFLAVHFSLKYSYEDYKDYLTLISGVSGGIFTIMGIWIAFLYPNALSRIVNPSKIEVADFSESLSDAKRLESIVGAVLASALVMVSALMITLAKIILLLTPFYLSHRMQIKALAFSVLIFITLAQLEAVAKVVLANVMFINDLHWKRQARKSDEEL